jgi:hypothetical protein
LNLYNTVRKDAAGGYSGFIPDIEFKIFRREFNVFKIHVEVIQRHRTTYVAYQQCNVGEDTTSLQVLFFIILSKLNLFGMSFFFDLVVSPLLRGLLGVEELAFSFKAFAYCFTSTNSGFLYHVAQLGNFMLTSYCSLRSIATVIIQAG